MSNIIYSESTKKLFQELTQQARIAHDKNLRHLKTPKKLRGVRKLYENDTSKFEPIPENRDHLIKTLMPMVIKIATGICQKFNSKIEFDDCISEGMRGAIIATDLYIQKSEIEPQPAKLSTYAHAYIVKYINEHCYRNSTILSHGPTKWDKAVRAGMLSGNQTYQSEGRSAEFFDIANDSNLKSHQNLDKLDDASIKAEQLSEQIFSCLTQFDKVVVFLSFGICADYPAGLTAKEISLKLNCTIKEVKESLEKSIESMKNSIDAQKIDDAITILRSTDLTQLHSWSRL